MNHYLLLKIASWFYDKYKIDKPYQIVVVFFFFQIDTLIIFYDLLSQQIHALIQNTYLVVPVFIYELKLQYKINNLSNSICLKFKFILSLILYNLMWLINQQNEKCNFR